MNINESKENKKYFQLNIDNKNCGESIIQIKILTNKINYLQKHFIFHKKDHCGRKGLLKIVSRRRKLLNYLKKISKTKYLSIIKNLSLRY